MTNPGAPGANRPDGPTASADRKGADEATVPHLGASSAATQATMAKGAALNLLGSAINALGNFALIVVITRGLGQGQAGAFLEATAMFQLLAKGTMLGADTGLARYLPASIIGGRSDELGNWSRVGLIPVGVVATGIAALAVAFAAPLGGAVASGPYEDVFVGAFRVLACFIPVGAIYFVVQTGTRAFGTMVPSVVVERVGRAITQPAVLLIAVIAGAGPTLLAWAWIGPYAAAAIPLGIWYGVLLRRAGTGTGRADLRSHLAQGRIFWGFAGPRALAGVFQAAILWLDVVLVGALSDTSEAALYAASSRWLVGGLFVQHAIIQAFQPQISAVFAGRRLDEAQGLFRTATVWMVAVVWPLYLTLVVFGPVLMGIFGADYRSGAAVLAILAVAGMIGSGTGPVDMVLLMGGRSRANLINVSLGLSANVAVNLALVPIIGALGAAVAWAVSIAVVNSAALVQVHRSIGIDPFGRGYCLVALLATGVVGGGSFVMRLVLGATVPGLVVALVVVGLAYGAVMWRARRHLDVDAVLAALRRAKARRRGGSTV